MFQLTPIIFIGFVFLVIIIIATVAYFKGESRKNDLFQLAQSIGWSFSPLRDPSAARRFAQFRIFQEGRGRNAYNTMRGQFTLHGYPCQAEMGDYHYVVDDGDDASTTFAFSYLVVQLPFRYVPDLLIRPEGFLDKIAGALGFDDIDFESHEFSRKYCVKCADHKFAYDVITPTMMEFMLHSRPGPIHLCEGCICLSDGKTVWEPETFHHEVNWLDGFFQRWPDFVVANLTGDDLHSSDAAAQVRGASDSCP